jgi:hypothetical protein
VSLPYHAGLKKSLGISTSGAIDNGTNGALTTGKVVALNDVLRGRLLSTCIVDPVGPSESQPLVSEKSAEKCDIYLSLSTPFVEAYLPVQKSP